MAKESRITLSGLATGLIAALLVTLALAMGIRQLHREGVLGDRPAAEDRKERTTPRTSVRTDSPPQAAEQNAEPQISPQEDTQAPAEAQARQPVEETQLASGQTTQPTEGPTPAAAFEPGTMAQGMAAWQGVWADLNLTPAEQARLQEGWALAMQKWQNMSPEEQQAQRERMTASWQKFQSMSDEEKEQASRELRGRFEDWRQSGSSELPDMILD